MATSASAIRAGAAYVELFAKDKALVSGLRSAETKIKNFGRSIGSIGTQFAALGGAIFLPLLAAAKTFASSGSALLLMSQRTGVSVEALSQLSFAAQQAGVEIEDLETGIIRMSRNIGSGGSSLDERLAQVADEIAGMQDPAQRTARAIDVFGRGGAALIPLLIRGSAGIRELREEADRLGLTKSLSDVLKAREAEVAINNAGRSIRSVFTAIGGTIAPAITAGARKVLEFITIVRNWVKENRTLFTVLLAVSGVVFGLGTALAILGRTITFLGSGFGLLASVITLGFSTVASIVTAVLSPIGLLAAGFGATVFLILRGTTSISNGFRAMSATAVIAWGAIGDAIAAGDWSGAMEIAWLGVQVIFRQAIAVLSSAWRDFSGFFVEMWHTAVSAVAQLVLTLSKFALGVISGIIDGLAAIGGGVGLDIQNPLAGMAANLEAVQANMTQQDAEDEARRRREREAANAADQAEIANLQGQIQAVADAAAIRRIIGEDIAGLFGPGGPEGAVGAAAGRDVRGTFSAAAATGLGTTSVTDRIATATEQTARNTGRMAQPAFT